MEYNIYVGTTKKLNYQFTEDYQYQEDAFQDSYEIAKRDFYEIKGRLPSEEEWNQIDFNAIPTTADNIPDALLVGSRFM